MNEQTVQNVGESVRVLRNIGQNRGAPRLWLEKSILTDFGWSKGDRFSCVFGTGFVQYVRDPEGKRKVAGVEGRPIIDTNTPKLATALDDAETVHVTANSQSITITKAS